MVHIFIEKQYKKYRQCLLAVNLAIKTLRNKLEDVCMPENILAAIEGRMADFTKLQKKIGFAILDEPMSLAFASIDQAAQQIGVSTATIVRFANNLGFDGYSELQSHLQMYCQEQIHPLRRLDGNAAGLQDDSTIVGRIYKLQLENLQKTYEKGLHEKLNNALQAILNAKNIYCSGSRGSYSVAYYLAHHINRVARNCYMLELDTRLPDYLLHICPDDVFLVVNLPRFSRQLYLATLAAQERGAKIIVISDTAASPYFQLADVFFFASSISGDFHNSLLSAMLIAEILISLFISKKLPDVRHNLDDMEYILKKMETFL